MGACLSWPRSVGDWPKTATPRARTWSSHTAGGSGQYDRLSALAAKAATATIPAVATGLRDVEMTNEDILHFQQQLSPDRFYPPGHKLAGRPNPLHPIIIEGVGSMLQVAKRYE
jgi:hypothetical protein